MSMKLWHCFGSRSVRPLWALEEMGLEYDLVSMPFPPRFKQEGYLSLNSLGTVPYFEDGETQMTESVAICHYLVEKTQNWEFGLRPDEPEYSAYLNWLYHSDATLTFPQTVYLRFAQFEKQRGLEEAGLAYADWFRKRLVRLEAWLGGRDYLVGQRFTVADIAVGYAIYLANFINILGEDAPKCSAYYNRLSSRPAFQRALMIGAEHNPFK